MKTGQVEGLSGVRVGRQRLPWIVVLEEIDPSEIELFACKQVPELPEIHEAANHDVVRRLLAGVVGNDGHSTTLAVLNSNANLAR